MNPTICLAFLLAAASASEKLNLLYKWKAVEFEFPSKESRDNAIYEESFIPGNNIPLDVDHWEYEGKKKTFVTIPRFQKGTPASLATISENRHGEGHLLRPYPPDYNFHKEGNCQGLTSAFRTQIDQCGRLWVIDSGIIFQNPDYRVCSPQLLAFNLRNDHLVGRHKFSENVLTPRSVLTTIAVDVRDPHDKCKETYVYVSDVTQFALLVFDAKNNKAWRVQSNTMYPYPPQGVFKTNGVEFFLMDGILGLALSPNGRGERTLYYHSFASLRESWVSTAVLKNESEHPKIGLTHKPREFQMSEEARPSQAAAEVFDRNGNLYFGLIAQNSLVCWNSEKPYTRDHLELLAQDDASLQFITGIKVREDKHGNEELYFITNRFQLFMVGEKRPREINIRIFKAKISDLIKGTGCKGDQKKPSPFTFPNRPSSGYGTFEITSICHLKNICPFKPMITRIKPMQLIEGMPEEKSSVRRLEKISKNN